MARGTRPSLRLDRLVAHATGLSRAQAQHAIRSGAVRIGGQAITDPAMPVAEDAQVVYDGELLSAGPRYFMLHKPAGVICATRDRLHRTVLDLLDVPNHRGLHVAGRLDLDSTGLVLITDDGEWSHRVTHPRHKMPKTYRVDLAEPLSAEASRQMRHGVALRGEPKSCAPAVIEELAPRQLRVTITEGKYHQVKRMFAAVGNRVVALHREQIGPVRLDPALAEGESRPLHNMEVNGLRDESESGT